MTRSSVRLQELLVYDDRFTCFTRLNGLPTDSLVFRQDSGGCRRVTPNIDIVARADRSRLVPDDSRSQCVRQMSLIVLVARATRVSCPCCNRSRRAQALSDVDV
jgi:hypothetical protein